MQEILILFNYNITIRTSDAQDLSLMLLLPPPMKDKKTNWLSTVLEGRNKIISGMAA
jgi:hypothetical protein